MLTLIAGHSSPVSDKSFFSAHPWNAYDSSEFLFLILFSTKFPWVSYFIYLLSFNDQMDADDFQICIKFSALFWTHARAMYNQFNY